MSDAEGHPVPDQYAGKVSRRSLFAAAPFVLVIEASLLLYLLPRDQLLMWEVQRFLHGDPQARQMQLWRERMKNDLRLGTRAPRIEEVPVSQKVPLRIGSKTDKLTLLIFMGTCNS